MVKIKTKKKMTLPELIQWGWKNGVTDITYIASEGGEVYFDGLGWFRTEVDVYPEETFTIEVEEEFTEETKIPTLIAIGNTGYGKGVSIDNDCSITDFLKRFVTDGKDITKAFYMLNDDYTMTLLWKDGGMVE